MTTTPSKAVLAAAVQDALDAIGCELTMSDCRVAAAAVVAALRLPERDRETAARAWDEGVVRGLQTADWEYGAETNMPDQTNPYTAPTQGEKP